MREAVIVSAVRTAAGRAKKGILRDTRPDDMMGICVREAITRAPGLKDEEVDDVIVGCAMPEGEQGMNVARISVFRAKLPSSVPAFTVNRFCSSGLQSIVIGCRKVMMGDADVVVAGGVESMTMVPMGGNKPSANPTVMDEWPEAYTPMGITAEIVVKRMGISREDQDRFAYESHMKAIAAIDGGKFKDEITPILAKVREPKDGGVEVKEVLFEVDECPRRDTTLEALAKLRPVFAKDGTVTAGNSSPMNDGAAAVVIMSREKANALGLKPFAKYIAHRVGAVDPEVMGLGPTVAIPKVLKATGLTYDDMEFIELNEAFAGQSLGVIRSIDLPMEKLNINGGAVALGHPLGCTGAKLTVQTMYELRRRGSGYAMVTMCIGGGMGAAAIFQRE
jgi:acetyl-CoA acyltransferase